MDEKKEDIDLKEIRKKLEEKIESVLPKEFKERHADKIAIESTTLDDMREVDRLTAKRIVEAFLFSASKPVFPKEIKKVLRGYSVSQIEELIEELKAEYERDNRSFQIQRIAEGYEMATESEYYRWLRKADIQKKPRMASVAALETISVIAYKQPVTRNEIEELRGVDVSGVLATLLERNFVKITGRKEVPGRPLLYATTDNFLEHFGLSSLEDLPRIHEIKEIVQASVKRSEILEKEKQEAEKKKQEDQRKAVEQEQQNFSKEQEEVRSKFESIAGDIEGVAVLKEKQLKEILSPPEEEKVQDEESALEDDVEENTQEEITPIEEEEHGS